MVGVDKFLQAPELVGAMWCRGLHQVVIRTGGYELYNCVRCVLFSIPELWSAGGERQY